MIVTPLKTFKVPCTTRTPSVTNEDNVQTATELAAWLRGEDACLTLVNSVPFARVLWSTEKVRDPSNDAKITVICTDGEHVYSKARMCRRYHLINDYFTDFPDESSIRVPYTLDEVTNMTSCLAKLVDCYELLSYFNPRHAITYFEHKSQGSSRELLVKLTNDLSDEERIDLLRARRMRGKNFPLPDEGMGLGILAYILSVHDDWENLKSIFSGYPSYLTFVCDDVYELTRLLLTADYDNGEYWNTDTCERHVLGLMSLMVSGAHPLDPQETPKKILAMMGMRHSLFKNENTRATLPYHTYIHPTRLVNVEDQVTMDMIVRVANQLNPDATAEEIQAVVKEVLSPFKPRTMGMLE